MLRGYDEWLARGAEEALGEDDSESVEPCEGVCTCGAECVIEEKPKPKYEFYSLIYGNKLGEI